MKGQGVNSLVSTITRSTSLGGAENEKGSKKKIEKRDQYLLKELK